MSKRNIYLCQVNNRFDDQVFLPYSVGILQSYCAEIPAIKENYDFRGFIYLREDLIKLADSLENPDIFGFSCYIWNWEYNKQLASKVKALYPNCLIVMGGPQVPQNSSHFFSFHPYIDILVHNEGEIAFSEILLENMKESPDFRKIRGLSIKVNSTDSFKTLQMDRITDINSIPSPYLNGVFDDLVKIPHKWNASHETNRGCPYSCTFCDWGSAVYTKLRRFSEDRLEREMEWFGRHQIEIVYNCDANYGILDRDYNLTLKLAEIRREYGFPRQFRTAFAKTNPENIYRIAEVLQEADMQKGITLSTQSMDTQTLKNVKRKNLSNDQLLTLFKQYRNDKIPTYTEIIIGLPGETYSSFKAGINLLLEIGQHDGLCIYFCMVLPNSELANRDYRDKFEIKTRKMPLILAYVIPNTDDITEYHDIVVETKDMPLADWKRCVALAWVIQSFHCLNLTQYLTVYLRAAYGIAYDHFYDRILDSAGKNPNTLIGRQLIFISDLIDAGLDGKQLPVVVSEYGETTWFPEEAVFLKLVDQKDEFYTEIRRAIGEFLLSENISFQDDLIDELVLYQQAILFDPHSAREITLHFQYDWPNFFSKAYFESRVFPEKREVQVTFIKSRDYRHSPKEYALDIVRFGRKSSKLHRQLAKTYYK